MSSDFLRGKRWKLWWLGEKKKKKRDACGNNKTKRPCRRERFNNNEHVLHGSWWPPQGEITTACSAYGSAYGSYSQYRKNDPPGQPMAKTLCVCRLSTHIVLSIQAPIPPGKQGKPRKKRQEESYLFWRNWQSYIQIFAIVTLAQRTAGYSGARTKKVLQIE